MASSPVVDPFSSRQDANCQETPVCSSRVQTGLEPARARGPPGVEGLESARLVHDTIPDRRILKGNNHGRGGEERKATHERKEHIPAPKAVVLYDGERVRDSTGQR